MSCRVGRWTVRETVGWPGRPASAMGPFLRPMASRWRDKAGSGCLPSGRWLFPFHLSQRVTRLAVPRGEEEDTRRRQGAEARRGCPRVKILREPRTRSAISFHSSRAPSLEAALCALCALAPLRLCVFFPAWCEVHDGRRPVGVFCAEVCWKFPRCRRNAPCLVNCIDRCVKHPFSPKEHSNR